MRLQVRGLVRVTLRAHVPVGLTLTLTRQVTLTVVVVARPRVVTLDVGGLVRGLVVSALGRGAVGGQVEGALGELAAAEGAGEGGHLAVLAVDGLQLTELALTRLAHQPVGQHLALTL